MTPEQAAGLLSTLKGIEVSFGFLNMWVFLMLLFKDMGHK